MTHAVVGIVAFGLGLIVRGGEPAEEVVETPGVALAPGVTGLGGVFFKTADPDALRAWYRTHLGIEALPWGGYPFQWRELGRPDEIGYTVWGPFADDTKSFAPSPSPVMLNYRVTDLAGLIEQLRAAGVAIVGEIESHPNGKFAWILDLEGRKVELWEPVPSAEDPYLE